MSNKTELKNRTLWYDGDSTYQSCDVPVLLNQGYKSKDIHVDHLSKDIIEFNKITCKQDQITVKQDCIIEDPKWCLPDEYQNMDVYEAVNQLTVQYCVDAQCSDDDIQRIVDRVNVEYDLYVKHDKIDVLRSMFYIVNVLRTNNIVWGVGRGSSVSSFILYLIGVHDVDSYAYDLDITDFLA